MLCRLSAVWESKDRSLGVPHSLAPSRSLGVYEVAIFFVVILVMSPVNFKNVLMLWFKKKKHPKTKSFFSHLIFHDIVTGIKSDRDMAVIFQFNWQWKRHFKKLLSQQATSVYSQRKEIYWNCVVHLILTKHEEKLSQCLKFHLLIYSFEIVKIHGRLMNKLIMLIYYSLFI